MEEKQEMEAEEGDEIHGTRKKKHEHGRCVGRGKRGRKSGRRKRKKAKEKEV